MDLVVAAILDRGREEIEAVRGAGVQVVKDAAALEVGCGVFEQVLPDGLEQRVAGGDPLKGGVLGQELLVENDVFVFVAEFAEAGFEPFADGPELAGNAADAVGVRTGKR